MPDIRPAPPRPEPASERAGAILRQLAPARACIAARDAGTIALQVAAANISAPTGHEHRRARWMAERFQDAGIADVGTDAAGNVIACIPGRQSGAGVVVLSHLDTVSALNAPVRVRQDGPRLIGPGINDNARGLAVMLAIAGELASGRVVAEGPVSLVATTGEEGAGDLRGAKHFFSTHPQVAAAIALDGAGDDRIVNAALGSRRLRIAFDGPGGHSWSAFGTVNAVHAAAECAARLARIELSAPPRATLSVGRIGGGESVNAIPVHAWLEVDARSADSSTLGALEREIRHVVSRTVADHNRARAAGTAPLSATVERFGDRPSGVTPADHPLVMGAMAITRALGLEPRLALASTDANVPMSLGIPAIAIGAGGIGGDAHTANEWYENVEGPRGITRALAIVVAAAAM